MKMFVICNFQSKCKLEIFLIEIIFAFCINIFFAFLIIKFSVLSLVTSQIKDVQK